MTGKVVFDWRRIWIFVGLFIVLMSGFLFFSTREKQEKKEEKGGGDIVNELKIEDVKEGEGDGVQEGDTVSVHYKGTLLDGTVFDSSYERGEPFEFTVGEGSVIQGWEEGLIGMRVGGIRKLTIPPELGYGDREAGDIPANSTLIFEIELLEIK
jgi:FKBP-type peptidyl-prolyl cis-trans isomerase